MGDSSCLPPTGLDHPLSVIPPAPSMPVSALDAEVQDVSFFILHWCKRVLAHFEISSIEFLSMFRRKKIKKIGHFLCNVTRPSRLCY